MLVACMVAFTVTAKTTAKPEQKQETALVKEFTPFTNAVSVVKNIDFVLITVNTNVFDGNVTIIYSKKYEPLDLVVLDVGWSNRQQVITTPIYREKLLKDYNLPFKSKQLQSATKIRADC